jgi:hypothetical protein
VQNIVNKHDLSCAPFDTYSSVYDACERAKIHQLPYTSFHRVSTMPLELIHFDI